MQQETRSRAARTRIRAAGEISCAFQNVSARRVGVHGTGASMQRGTGPGEAVSNVGQVRAQVLSDSVHTSISKNGTGGITRGRSGDNHCHSCFSFQPVGHLAQLACCSLFQDQGKRHFTHSLYSGADIYISRLILEWTCARQASCLAGMMFA